MQHLNRILDHIWTRRKRAELREAHSRKQSFSSGCEIAVGDIVLVNDPDHPRTFWKLARVMKLIRSVDGQVKGAHIRAGLLFDQRKPCTLWRFMAHHQNHQLKLSPRVVIWTSVPIHLEQLFVLLNSYGMRN